MTTLVIQVVWVLPEAPVAGRGRCIIARFLHKNASISATPSHNPRSPEI
jgi:hypothetical protein